VRATALGFSVPKADSTTYVLGENGQNFAVIANLDKTVTFDISPQYNHLGARWNENYAPVIVYGKNGHGSSSQLDGVSSHLPSP
jgi:hypothetical protein